MARAFSYAFRSEEFGERLALIKLFVSNTNSLIIRFK